MPLFYVLIFCCAVFVNETQAQGALNFMPPPSQLMCAATAVEGRCVGSASCRVCTDCSRCAHCKSRFRSCGVCGKGRERTSNKRDQPATVYTPPNEGYRTLKNKWFTIKQETSLRSLPDSQADVILRFKEGDQVQVLEDGGLYWWVVVFEGKTGWVKKNLLQGWP